MKNKGFTLIELLAVIIIIGVIAVITIPKIADSLETAKKNVAQTSAYGYKKTINELILNKELEKNKIKLQGEYNINDDGNIYNENTEYTIDNKGKKPKNGVLIYDQNELVSGCLTIDKYRVTFENGEVISTEKGTCEYDKILTRIEKLPQQTDDYIVAVEDADINESGIYSVSELNNLITYEGELPTNGWVSLVYDEINGNWVWKYSIKYRENEVISYDGTNQTSSSQLASEPDLTLIAGTNAKTAGDEIAIGTEHFYIMENTGTKIIALAKANLNVGANKNTNLTEGIQGEAGQRYAVKFVDTEFWINPEATASPYVLPEYRIGTTGSTANVYDPINYAGEPGTSNYSIAYYVVNYINYLNTNYSSLNVTGRLLTKNEYAAYKTNYQSRLESQNFWLGTGYGAKSNNVVKGYVYTQNASSMPGTSQSSYGVRPVIEINTSNI